jgi:hypothetical protein
VNMNGFRAIAGIEEEAIGAVPENRWHGPKIPATTTVATTGSL